MQEATDLQHLDHLLQIHALGERLHVDLRLFVVVTQVFVRDAEVDALVAHLSEPAPELDKGVFTQHLIEGCAGSCPALPLPFVEFAFKLIDVEAELECGR